MILYDFSKFNLSDEQMELAQNILDSNNSKIDYNNLSNFDSNLFKAVEHYAKNRLYDNKFIMPIIVDKTTKLLDCNMEYLICLSKYHSHFEKVISKWNRFLEVDNYSLFYKYIEDIYYKNKSLFLKVLMSAPFLISSISNLREDDYKTYLSFVPSIYKYMFGYHNNLELSQFAVQVDVNNINYVSKDILEDIIKNY